MFCSVDLTSDDGEAVPLYIWSFSREIDARDELAYQREITEGGHSYAKVMGEIFEMSMDTLKQTHRNLDGHDYEDGVWIRLGAVHDPED